MSAEDVLQILRLLASHSKAFSSLFPEENSDAESETEDLALIDLELSSQIRVLFLSAESTENGRGDQRLLSQDPFGSV